MSEFKAITTQEEFDAAIKERLARNTKSITDEVTKKYEGFISPDEISKREKALNDKITALTAQAGEKDKSIADLTSKNQVYELNALKAKIAREKGIPYELAQRLTGSTEEELSKDADEFAKYMPKKTAPLHDPEGGDGLSGVEKAFYMKNPELKSK